MAHETNSILCKLFLLPLNKSLKKGDERSQKHLETNEFVWNFFLKEHFSYGVIERVHSWHHTYVENIYTRIYWEMEMQCLSLELVPSMVHGPGHLMSMLRAPNGFLLPYGPKSKLPTFWLAEHFCCPCHNLKWHLSHVLGYPPSRLPNAI